MRIDALDDFAVEFEQWHPLFSDHHLSFELSCTDGTSIFALDRAGGCWIWDKT